MPTIKINDITLYYELHGSGEPLVLIGGLALDVSEYEGMIRWFGERYRVLAFDNRGVGRTDKPDNPYTIEMMAQDSRGLMDALGIERAHVLGISMGGRIALELVLSAPHKVVSLILISTSAQTRRSRRHQWFIKLMARLPILKGQYPQPYYAFLRQLQATSLYDCTARLSALRLPTLILHGKRDTTTPYALAEEMHAHIAGSRLITFEGGHLFFLFRERQAFLNAVAAYLEEQMLK